MATFVMLGQMSADSIKQISPQRTVDALALVKNYGGEIKAGYSMLGKYDLIMIVELPNLERAFKLSVALSRLLGIMFTTSPAITFDAFDKVMEE